MVYEIVKHITGCDACGLYDRRLTIDLRTYEPGFQDIVKRKTCPLCR